MMYTLKRITCAFLCLAYVGQTLANTEVSKVNYLLQSPFWWDLASHFDNEQILDKTLPYRWVTVRQFFGPVSRTDLRVVTEENVKDKIRQYYNLLMRFYADVIDNHLNYLVSLKNSFKRKNVQWDPTSLIIELITNYYGIYSMMDAVLTYVTQLYFEGIEDIGSLPKLNDEFQDDLRYLLSWDFNPDDFHKRLQNIRRRIATLKQESLDNAPWSNAVNVKNDRKLKIKSLVTGETPEANAFSYSISHLNNVNAILLENYGRIGFLYDADTKKAVLNQWYH